MIGSDSKDEKWLSMPEAAGLTPYSAEYLSLLARRGKLGAKKIGYNWYTTETIIREYIAKQAERKSKEEEKWISMPEAAGLTPYSAEYLSLLARKGRLKSKKVGYNWYTTKDIVDEYTTAQAKRRAVSAVITKVRTPSQWDFRPVVIEKTLITFASVVVIAASSLFWMHSFVPKRADLALDTLAHVSKVETAEGASIFSGLTTILNRFFPPQQLAVSTTTAKFVQFSDLEAVRASLKKDLTEELLTQAPRPAPAPIATAQTSTKPNTQAVDLERIAHTQVIYNVYQTISNQSDSNVDLLGPAIEGLRTNGVFTGSTISGATLTSSSISGSLADVTGLAFGTASGTSATTTNIFSTNATFTNLISTAQNITNLVFGSATGTSATTTNFFATTASSTNLFATNLTATNVSFNGLGSLTNLLVTGSTSLQSFTALSSTSTNATTTTSFATTASSTNLFSTRANFASAILALSTTTSATSTNFFASTASSTNLFSTSANFGGATLGYSTTTNATTTNLAVSGSLNLTGLTTGSVPFIGAGGLVSQNNGQLFWDNSQTFLGIGITNPTQKLQVSGGIGLFDAASVGAGANSSSGIRIVAPIASTNFNWMIGGNQNAANAFEITPSTATGGTSFTTPAITVLSGGNVGVGTTNPQTRGDITIDDAVTNGVTYPLFVSHSTTGTAADGIGSGLEFRAERANGAIVQAGQIAGVLTGTGTGNNLFSALTFNVVKRNNAGGYVEAMRISEDGNVGIGTTTPSSNLHVYGTGNTSLTVETNGAALVPNINLKSGTLTWQIGNNSNVTNHPLLLTDGTHNNLSLLDNGNVGIGVLNPATLAEINTATAASSVTNGAKLRISGNGNTGFSAAEVQLYDKSADANWNLRMVDATDGGRFQISQGSNGANTSDYLTILTSGNVGIGDTNPASKLTVNGDIRIKSGSGGQLIFADGSTMSSASLGSAAALSNTADAIVTGDSDASGGGDVILKTASSDRLHILNGGNVGIGTTNPETRLHADNQVNTAYQTGSSIVDGTTFAANTAELTNYKSDASYSSLRLATRNSGSSVWDIANIWRATNLGDLAFRTRDSAGVGTGSLEVMRLSSSGNVGIGTTTPSVLLHLYSTGINGTHLDLQSADTGGKNWEIVSTGSNNGGGAGNLLFSESSTGAKGVWTPAGNFGIGTTTPLAKLVVNDQADIGNTNFVGLQLNRTTDQFNDLQWTATSTPLWSLSVRKFNENNDFQIYRYNAGFSAALTISRLTGNVGIGTTTPAAALAISKAGGVDVVLDSTVGVGSSIGRYRYSNTGTFIADITGGVEVNSTSGNLQFRTASSGTNTERMRIDSSGNVGIGTTTPQSPLSIFASSGVNLALDKASGAYLGFSRGGAFTGSINGTSAGNGLQFNYGSAHTFAMAIDGSGNVGIGITNPSAKLEVNGVIKITAGSGGGLTFADGTTITSNAAAGAGVTSNTDVSLAADADANGSGVMTFATHGSERMRVDNGGFVGIGTTAPGSPLEVVDTSTGASMRIRNTSSSGFGAIDIFDSSGAKVSTFAHSNSAASLLPSSTWFGSRNAEPLYFVTNGSTPRVTIDATGNMGIGTTTPDSVLSINAAGTATPDLRIRRTAVGGNVTGLRLTSNGNGTVNYRAAQLQLSVPAGNTTDASLDFVVGNASTETVGTTAMSILTNGNIGIGTTTPHGLLELNNTAVTGPRLYLSNANATSKNASIRFASGGASTLNWDITTDYVGNGGTELSIVGSDAAQKMTFLQNGNVGIGTTTPNIGAHGSTRKVLTIMGTTDAGVLELGASTGTNGASSLRINGYNGNNLVAQIASTGDTGSQTLANLQLGTSGSTRMTIDSGGNVGIGLTANQNHEGVTPLLEVATSNVVSRLSSFDYYGADGNGPILDLAKSRGASVGTVTYPQTDDLLGTIFFSGANQNQSRFNDGARLQSGVGSTWTSANQETYLTFYTTPSGVVGSSEHMRITGAGNVGIGTTTPASLLNLYDSSNNSNPTITLSGGTGSGPNAGEISFYSNSGAAEIARIQSQRDGNNTDGNILFFTAAPSSAVSERMRLDHNGIFTINNTSAPQTVGYLQVAVADNAANNSGLTITASRTNVTNQMGFYNPNGLVGSITTTNSATAFNTSSDIRLKENIVDTHYSLADLMRIQVSDFSFKTDTEHKMQNGFIAQQLNTIYPDAVTVGGEDPSKSPWTVDYGRLTPLLTKSIQELSMKVDLNASTTNIALVDINIRLDSIEQRLTALENASSSYATSTGLTLDATTTQSIVSSVLTAIGGVLDNGWLRVRQLAVETFHVGSATNPTGITLYDAANGSPYCLRVYNGQSITTPGDCSGAIDLGQSTVVGSMPTTPPAVPDLGSTSGTTSSTTSTSTESIASGDTNATTTTQ